MPWRFDTVSSVSGQIASSLRIKILMGEYNAGEQFPTVRSLACELAVNPNTVQKALCILEQEGLLVSQTTVGRFVTEDREVLGNALNYFRESFMKNVISKAKDIGITKKVFTDYIGESEELL